MFFVDWIFIVFYDSLVCGIVNPFVFFDGVSVDFIDSLAYTTWLNLIPMKS